MTLIRFDANISPRIASAIRSLVLPNEVEIEDATLTGDAGATDVDWIESFSRRGGRLLISGDEKMRDRPFERAALEMSGLIAVFPPESRCWRALRLFGQAAFLIRWFPVIAELARDAQAGEHFRLPPTFTTTEREQVVTLRRLVEIGDKRRGGA